MPEKRTLRKAQKSKQEGKAPSTQAGAFVHEEIEHIRKGKHGARNPKQAIAIGLSKARRSGVDIPESPTRKSRRPETQSSGRIAKKKTSSKRSSASLKRMQQEPKSSASHESLSSQTRSSAQKAARTRTSTAKKAA